MEEKFEDRSICAKCGGACCKKSGCGYIVEDFSTFKLMDLKAKLDEGNISIKSVLYACYDSGREKLEKILVLKSRSVDKGVVDLFSANSQCKMLTENGCAYSLAERPSLGAILKPSLQGGCRIDNDTQIAAIEGWKGHQAVLEKLVKIYTGKNADTVYSEQFVEEGSLVLAKVKLLRGDFRKLDIPDLEVYDTMMHVKEFLPYEYKEAVHLADEIINSK